MTLTQYQNKKCGWQVINFAIKFLGLPEYFAKSFEGQAVGSTDSFPVVTGGYSTVCYGGLVEYEVCTKEVGQAVLSPEGLEYIVTKNGGRTGNGWSPSDYSFVAAPSVLFNQFSDWEEFEKMVQSLVPPMIERVREWPTPTLGSHDVKDKRLLNLRLLMTSFTQDNDEKVKNHCYNALGRNRDDLFFNVPQF